MEKTPCPRGWRRGQRQLLASCATAKTTLGRWANIGEAGRRLTDTTKDGPRLAVRGCDHYECRDGQAVRKGSHWKVFE